MNRSASHASHRTRRDSTWWQTTRRAFAEFLWFPTVVIATFVLLAGAFYALERAPTSWIDPVRDLLRTRFFTDPQATADLLSTIAGSLITVTSITISLLLVALQQAAASLTFAVFDQFLRRRHNQFYFGFFVGVALFALITLATVNEPFNPVLAAAFALLLTVVALLLLIVLLYTTINQMRPVEIIESVRHMTLTARARQLPLLRRTRRHSRFTGRMNLPVHADRHGFVTRIDLDAIESGMSGLKGEVEIDLKISMGSFVAYGDTLVSIAADHRNDADTLAGTMQRAIHLERQRDIAEDPAYGLEQLENIAWTSISTSKSNPAPGRLTIQGLRDLLGRWASDERHPATPPENEVQLPLVYRDNVVERLFEALETLAVVSTESMQHQNFTEVLRVFTATFERLPLDQQERAEDLILRVLSGMGDHVLTTELDKSLDELGGALARASRTHTASAIETARAKLLSTVGELHSRSTRAEGGSGERLTAL